jgi:hypothetical protein
MAGVKFLSCLKDYGINCNQPSSPHQLLTLSSLALSLSSRDSPLTKARYLLIDAT